MLFTHIMEERASVSNGDYSKYLATINSITASEHAPSEREQIEKEYNNAHAMGIIAESQVLNEFLFYPDGTKPKLAIRIENLKLFEEIIVEKLNKTSVNNKTTFVYGSQAIATFESAPNNPASVISANFRITNPDINAKNGAIDKN